jgi:hypothetical protein
MAGREGHVPVRDGHGGEGEDGEKHGEDKPHLLVYLVCLKMASRAGGHREPSSGELIGGEGSLRGLGGSREWGGSDSRVYLGQWRPGVVAPRAAGEERRKWRGVAVVTGQGRGCPFYRHRGKERRRSCRGLARRGATPVAGK